MDVVVVVSKRFLSVAIPISRAGKHKGSLHRLSLFVPQQSQRTVSSDDMSRIFPQSVQKRGAMASPRKWMLDFGSASAPFDGSIL